MDNLIYILFICTVAPLLLMLPLLNKRSKAVLGYMIIGIIMSLFISEVNGILLNFFYYDTVYVTTTVTPVTEEIIKAIPILFYAFVFSSSKERLLPISVATGIGFGLFENMVLLVQTLVQNSAGVTVGWAVVRGFSTALMHGICTLTVGYGISFVHKKKKLFYCGTFALLLMAMIYHGIFNMLVQSDYRIFGYLMPAVTYIPILLYQYQLFKSRKIR